MPLRYAPTGTAITAQLATQTAAWSGRRFFHTSPRLLHLDSNTSDASNHYETLNVRPDASPAEIKRSFYLLSKRHHPDHNPSDPHAPSRFMRISEAYATLSHADKRALYDRDVMRTTRNNPHYHHAPKGSYHSTGPAGGRPASGLSSRRRGTYQGPPPSFFRSGGWGAHTAKRRAAHEESTGFGAGYGTDSSRGGSGAAGAAHQQPPPPPPPPHGSGGGGGGGVGGMGPGQNPFGHRDDVPHFDRDAHERAQRRGEELRARRAARRAGLNPDEPDSPTNMSFFAAAAILAVVVMAPLMLTGNRNTKNDKAAQAAARESKRENKAK
ncbi:uncharacterized protein B0T15DRAFT_523112 [Chaetomium strumarium]|uniref:J domain-containing protein n=1 Tax=Chaetomium strumarium TaxID=1170767 RepID=A0AAJ0M3R7_9PEZI|nr:hypothetical protein B0T15DRAFT_523112 [Chaetomium strumarium]